jgi:hypothetical protein
MEIVAAFHNEQRARRAVENLTQKGVSRGHLRVVSSSERDRTRRDEMRAEMQEEVRDSVAGPGVMLSPEQSKGAFGGAIAFALFGAVIGFAVGALWAWGLESAISPIGRLAIAVATFTVGGATVGFVAGGALKPRLDAAEHPGAMLDERRLAGESDTLLEVHVDDGSEATMVEKVLKDAGADRVDALSDNGTPLPPQREHPRPADPEGFWDEEGSGKG